MPIVTQGKNISSSAQINPGTIEGTDIANDAIDSQHYAADSIDNEHYAPGSIGNTEIDANAAIADTKLAQITTASKVSGAAITSLASLPAGAGIIPAANLPAAATSHKVGATTRDTSVATDLVIAHGLGATPSKVRLTMILGTRGTVSQGGFDGTNQAVLLKDSGSGSTYDVSHAIAHYLDGSNYNFGTVTVDGTNITIAWAKTGTVTGTGYILWEVIK